jgi:membrane protease subunit (stomatin/prohibitin family)
VLDSDNIPFLGQLVDKLTDGNVLQAEIFFVSLVQFTGIKFGGRIGKIRDPESGLATELMVHGTFALQAQDPKTMLVGLTGMGTFEQEGFYGWFREQVLKVIRDHLAELCVKKGWPLLDVTSGAYTTEVEEAVLEGVRDYVEDYGIQVPRLGNFNVGIDKEDEQRLEDFYEKAAYIRMAGGLDGYDKMAQADMKKGAAEGLAKGGGSGGSSLTDAAGLGIGLGVGQQMSQQGGDGSGGGVNLPGQQQAQDQQQSKPSDVECGACGAHVSPGKFCSECGETLQRKKFCSECGAQVSGKFCSECGTPTN